MILTNIKGMANRFRLSKYRLKLFYNFFFLFIAFAVAIALVQYKREKDSKTEQLENTLQTYIGLVNQFIIKNNIIQNNNFYLLDSLINYLPDKRTRVTVVENSGKVLFDSFVEQYAGLENHFERPEIQQSITSNYGSSIRYSTSTNTYYYYHAKYYNNYFVRVALPYNIRVKNLLKVDLFFIYIIIFIFIIATLSLIFISDHLGSTISQLQNFASKAASGSVIDTAEKFPDNELGEIGQQIVNVYTRLKKTKNDLIAEREKIFRHLQISHEGIAIFNRDKKQLLANNHFIQYLNTISDEPTITPNKVFDIPEFAPVTDFIDEQLKKNTITPSNMLGNILTIQKNGKWYVVQAIVFHDFTFEISINNTTKHEKDKKLKQQMTSNIAHELKTPVSSILGYLETILTTNVDDDKRRFFIERSYVQTQRLSSLIQDISLLNKIEEAGDLFEIETFRVNEIIRLVIDDLRPKIDDNNIGLTIDIKPELEINGNRSVFYSIWRNLVENSVNYAGPNTEILIKNYFEDDNYLYFSFADNGTGVPEQHLTRIFERFYRVDSGRSRSMGGTGLGLAIVKNGVVFHKGEISVKNLKTGGLEFIFTISKNITLTN